MDYYYRNGIVVLLAMGGCFCYRNRSNQEKTELDAQQEHNDVEECSASNISLQQD